MKRHCLCGLLLGAITAHAAASGHLVIERAWIRAAPPGAMMLAGYATLRNDGDAVLAIVSADSPDFGSVSVHESVAENGVEKMRLLPRLEIAPGASVALAPGGRHLMLMQPRRELKQGDVARIHLASETGGDATAEFPLRADPPDH